MGLLGAKSIVNKLGWVAALTVLAAVGILDGSPSSPAHLEPTWSTWAPPNVLVGDRASGRGGDTFTSRRSPRAVPLDHRVSLGAVVSTAPGQELTVRREGTVQKAQRHSGKNQVAFLVAQR